MDYTTIPPDEGENAGESGPPLGGYPIAAWQDTVFVYRTMSAETNNEFDDIIDWISPGILYSRLIAAGRMP